MKLIFRIASIKPYLYAQVKNLPVSIPKAYINLDREQDFSRWPSWVQSAAEIYLELTINAEPEAILYHLKNLE